MLVGDGKGEGGKGRTSSSISFRVLRPLAAKKSSRGFCSSLEMFSKICFGKDMGIGGVHTD